MVCFSKYYEKDALVADPVSGQILASLLGKLNYVTSMYSVYISILVAGLVGSSYYAKLSCNQGQKKCFVAGKMLFLALKLFFPPLVTS